MKHYTRSIGLPLIASAVALALVAGCSTRGTGSTETASTEPPPELTGGIENPVVAEVVAESENEGEGASESGSEINRAPAATPWAHGTPQARGAMPHNRTTPPRSNPPRTAQPFDPRANQRREAQEPAPTKKKKGAVANQPINSECGILIDKVPIAEGSPYSIWDVINPERTVGPEGVQRGLDFGTFSGNVHTDIANLEPWFGGILGGPGSEIAMAARQSRALQRALGFINGAMAPGFEPHPVGQRGQPQNLDPWLRPQRQNRVYTTDDYVENGKMAAVLAAMFAVSADGECVRLVRQLATKKLRPEIAIELDDPQLREALLSASEGIRTGAHARDWRELDKAHTEGTREIERISRAMEAKSAAAENETVKIQYELKKLYQDLKIKFVKLPRCNRVVTYQEKSLASFVSEKQFLKTLTDDCRREVDAELTKRHNDQLDIIKQSAELERERSLTAEGLEAPKTSKEEVLDRKLAATEAQVKDLQATIDWLNGVGEDSIKKESDAIERLLNRRTLITSSEYYEEENREIAAVQQKIDSDAVRWVTYGLTGGFEAPQWQQRYRNLRPTRPTTPGGRGRGFEVPVTGQRGRGVEAPLPGQGRGFENPATGRRSAGGIVPGQSQGDLRPRNPAVAPTRRPTAPTQPQQPRRRR